MEPVTKSDRREVESRFGMRDYLPRRSHDGGGVVRNCITVTEVDAVEDQNTDVQYSAHCAAGFN